MQAYSCKSIAILCYAGLFLQIYRYIMLYRSILAILSIYYTGLFLQIYPYTMQVLSSKSIYADLFF